MSTVTVRRDGPIGEIVLSRPNKLNALDRATIEAVTDAALRFDAEIADNADRTDGAGGGADGADRTDGAGGGDAVRVVVIRGEGRSFSAGFDLLDSSWAEIGPLERSCEWGRAMADAVAQMRAVTVASIQGHCVGGGMVLAAACDLRVAAADATFKIPEVDLGVPLYWAGIPLLVREFGPAVTKELVMTGRPFDTDEAQRLGFLNKVVSAAELETATASLARMLAAKSALVLATTKAQVNAVAAPIPADYPAVDVEVAGMGAAFADPESRRVAAAYLSGLGT